MYIPHNTATASCYFYNFFKLYLANSLIGSEVGTQLRTGKFTGIMTQSQAMI